MKSIYISRSDWIPRQFSTDKTKLESEINID